MASRTSAAVLLPVFFLIAGTCSCSSSVDRDEVQPAANDGWTSLFDGESLDGWRASENKSFKVEDGMIVVHGARSHLFYEGPVNNHDFKNFELKAEVLTKPNSNSGIYFHTEYQEEGWPDKGYEVQVNNSFKADPRVTGSLYGVKDVMNDSPVGDDKWFEYDIIVKDKHVTLNINGKKVNEYTEPDEPRHLRDFPGRLISHGTIALQGHDPGSEVHFRNIRIKPLP